MSQSIKKIAIIGPESTGKSTLCSELAAHYNSLWVKEYARTYLEKNGTNYSFENLADIATGQIKNEIEGIQHGEKLVLETNKDVPVFMDTELNVIKVWSEFVFNKCNNRILSEIAKSTYDLYLLCNTDLPWVKDNLREYPDLAVREKLFFHYKELLTSQNVPWVLIKGLQKQRLQIAIHTVDKLMMP